MRKRFFLAAVAAVVNVAMAMAQQIAVVSDGTTTMYQTLKDAITDAPGGSVIYLPGGGFQIADDVKITKRLTIIGIGHKAKGESADGNTIISGNLFFDGGSDHSAVMGCYISGNVTIGNDGSSVNNVTLKYCNLNSVQVKNNTCTGTIVNQNYIRNKSEFAYADVVFSNNIAYSVCSSVGATIINNIITWFGADPGYNVKIFYNCSNCTIANNAILYYGQSYNHGISIDASNSVVTNNLTGLDWGIDNITVSDWNEVFEIYNNGAISPASNFHFKGDYVQYENTIGIYAGENKFSDSGMAPVPYIMAKKVADQTDASGMLNVKIRVKGGE